MTYPFGERPRYEGAT